MKIAIILFVISTFLFFVRVNIDEKGMLDGTYEVWTNIKGISFLVMIGSFIAIVVMMWKE